MISPDNIFLYYWGMKASQAHYHGATPAFSVFTLLLLAFYLQRHGGLTALQGPSLVVLCSTQG